jgi:hypothetical protein
MGGRFFCENCGAEVKRDAETCPHCGMSFATVRCRRCGFAGEPRLFAAGCPACVYAAPKPMNAKGSPRALARGAPPAWAYLLAVLALAGIVALLLTK